MPETPEEITGRVIDRLETCPGHPDTLAGIVACYRQVIGLMRAEFAAEQLRSIHAEWSAERSAAGEDIGLAYSELLTAEVETVWNWPSAQWTKTDRTTDEWMDWLDRRIIQIIRKRYPDIYID